MKASCFGASLLRIDFLECIRSVVTSLLKNATRFALSGPNRRRIMSNSVGLHHLVNAVSQGRCANFKQAV